MGLFKRKKTEDPTKAQAGNPEEIDMSTGTAADVEEMMRKYDRESNTRIWEGTPQQIIRFGVAAFSLYCIIMTLVYKGMREVTLTAFLAMIVVIGYLHYPAKKGDNRVNHLPWYDIVIMLAGAGSLLYYTFNAEAIVKQAVAITDNPVMVILAVVAILSLMELCRRCVGIPILCVVGAILIYTFANVRFGKVIYDLFYAKTGIMNTPIDVCAKYIVVFVIFGAFLERTGIASFFIDFANRAVGRFSGGPAKVAVIASALEGMASGSSVANTVGSGSITIPMMKRTGYRPEFAAAVEAAASTGGQIMPPIMGAAAFLMAEYVNVPYATIAVTAILPAVLYFAGIYIAVHLEAKKMGLKGIPKDQLPRWRDLLKKCYLLIPLIVLVWLVSSGSRSMATSAALATRTAVIVGLLNWIFLRDEALTFNKFVDALAAGGRSIITVASACAMAGIVAGCVTSTGLASKLISAIVSISGGQAIIALALTMICCIILGMGVPTTANYCIMAATCAPILTSPAIGIPTMAAHFFVFYFGIVADITPPVALAAYAGSAIAKSDPMKTGIVATRLAIGAFIVPYIFALSPQMLFIDVHSVFEIVQICLSAILGIFGVAAALSGYIFRRIPPILRIVLAIGGLGMMIPGLVTDLIGLALMVGVCVVEYLMAKKEKQIPPPSAGVAP